MRHMNPNLMGTSGFQLAFDQAGNRHSRLLIMLQGPVVGRCPFATGF